MNTSNLEQYVVAKNQWREMFGDKLLSLLRSDDRQTIAQLIECDLSPENLTCDGEANPAWVRQQHAFLSRCAQELMSIDPSVEFYEFG
jgi:hypothetical protein